MTLFGSCFVCKGDAWSVPVAGAVFTACLAIMLPWKLETSIPYYLMNWSNHNDFPIPDYAWCEESDEWELVDPTTDPSPDWLLRVETGDTSVSWNL